MWNAIPGSLHCFPQLFCRLLGFCSWTLVEIWPHMLSIELRSGLCDGHFITSMPSSSNNCLNYGQCGKGRHPAKMFPMDRPYVFGIIVFSKTPVALRRPDTFFRCPTPLELMHPHVESSTFSEKFLSCRPPYTSLLQLQNLHLTLDHCVRVHSLCSQTLRQRVFLTFRHRYLVSMLPPTETNFPQPPLFCRCLQNEDCGCY